MEQDRVCMKKGSNTKACTPGFKQKKKTLETLDAEADGGPAIEVGSIFYLSDVFC